MALEIADNHKRGLNSWQDLFALNSPKFYVIWYGTSTSNATKKILVLSMLF